ncbi:MAG: LysM peptidoglycan-binding domain-containing protein [Oligoflexia bacterium]|nr:LysM peptidoglycan-binding domain-containing protein [Oligoflexia bacterium]
MKVIFLILTCVLGLFKPIYAKNLELNLAKSLAKNFDCPSAIKILEKEISKNKNLDEGVALLQDCLLKMKKFEELKAFSKEYLKENNLHLNSTIKLIQANLALNKIDEALEVSEMAYKIYFSNDELVNLYAQILFKHKNKTEKAIQILKEFFSQKQHSYKNRLLLANIYYSQSKFEMAFDEAIKIKQVGPITAELYIFLGKVNLNLNKSDKAFEDIKYAITLDPQKAEAFIELSKLHVALGDHLIAINVLAGAMDQVEKEEQKFILLQLARIHMLSGHHELARETIKSIEEDETVLEQANYVAIDNYLEQQKMDSAAQKLETFLENNPGRNWAILARARIYNLTSDEAAAEKWIFKNIDLSENKTELHNFTQNKEKTLTARKPALVVSYETVRQGDSLYEISRRIYGNALYWKKIYLCNKDVIKTPHFLKVGVRLKIARGDKCSD